MSTLKNIADRIGVSAGTVSRVLNNHPDTRVRKDKAQRIRQVAKEMKFRPNAAARSIRKCQTRQIGILLRNNPEHPLTNPSAFETILGINNRLSVEGYVTLLVRIGDVETALHRDSRVFCENLLDGIIVIGDIPSAILKHIDELTPNCLYVDTNVYHPRCCIQRDERAVGKMVAQNILAHGYKRLAWYGNMPDGYPTSCHYSVKLRYQGVKSVADQAGIPLLNIPFYARTHPQTLMPASEHIKAALASKIGVAAYCKQNAIQFATMAMDMGFMPRQHYGLACCDLTHDMADSWHTLAGAIYDRFETGVQVAQMMLQLLHQPELLCASRQISPTWHQGTTLTPVTSPPCAIQSIHSKEQV